MQPSSLAHKAIATERSTRRLAQICRPEWLWWIHTVPKRRRLISLLFLVRFLVIFCANLDVRLVLVGVVGFLDDDRRGFLRPARPS